MLRHIVMKVVLVLLSLTHTEVMTSEATAKHAEPSYAKWGKLALQETSNAYQDASILDYKYDGRHKLDHGQAEERFVLWVRKDSREFGVEVRIKINASSDELIQVGIKELTQK